MITDEQIQLLCDRYMLDFKWLKSLRDITFLLSWTHAPSEVYPEVLRISNQLDEEAWQVTQIIFPSAARDESRWLWINGEWMNPASVYWWRALVEKAEETREIKEAWSKT